MAAVADARRLSELIGPLSVSVPEASGAWEPQWPATNAGSSGSLRAADTPRTAPREPDHVFAIIMTSLALLAIAGPVWHMGDWRRRREIGSRSRGRALPYLLSTALDKPIGVPLEPREEAAELDHPLVPSVEPFDWAQQFAKAWQQLAEDTQKSRMHEFSAQRA